MDVFEFVFYSIPYPYSKNTKYLTFSISIKNKMTSKAYIYDKFEIWPMSASESIRYANVN